MAGRVFISHASADKALAHKACHVLEAQGIDCWIAPRNVPVGRNWAEVLLEAIDDSCAVLFLLSEASSQSGPVLSEIVRAGNQNKPIFTLKLGPVTSTSRLDFFIAPWHRLDLTHMSLEEALPHLVDSLRTLAVQQNPLEEGAPGQQSADPSQAPAAVMVLSASRHEHEDILRLSAYERVPGKARTVRPYEELPVSFTVVQQEIDSLLTLLEGATNSAGVLDAVTWDAIQTQGEKLYARLLSPAIREALKATSATDLLLYLDDTLVHIPWELLFDGAHFLCRRFSIGRSVSTTQPLAQGPQRQPAHPLKMLLVADPQGNLAAASQEGQTLQRELAMEGHHFRVDLRRPPVHLTAVTSAMAECDILHYAGHATYEANQAGQSSWLLADGQLTAEQVGQLGGHASMPALVFCNACQSGQTTAWQTDQAAGHAIYGLANAFLVAGTQHYIGTLWNIPDEPSANFAIEFYRALARGATVGRALRHARQCLITRYRADSVVWASYVLYGDPTSHYLETASAAPRTPAPPVLSTPVVRPDERVPRVRRKIPLLRGAATLSGHAEGASTIRRYNTPMFHGAAAVALLLLVFGTWWGSRLWTQPGLPAAPSSVASQTAAQWDSHRAPGSSPELAPLTVAYQTLEQGDQQKAQELFQALTAEAKPQEQSQGFVGLAAVAWARGEAQQVETLATQAEAADPEVVYSHVLRGDLLWQQGKTAEAMAAYRTATVKTHGIPWQHAMAYNRLGRLYAAQGELQQALEQYDKALSLSASGHQQEKAVAYANKGHALVTLGRYQEALEYYRQAMQLTPNDRLTTALLRDAERREQLAQDQEKQERIDKLVADLLQMQREGKTPGPTDDDWTSRPFVLGFLPFQNQGAPSLRAGEDEGLLARLMETFQDKHIRIVERELLDKLLAELKLSASGLVQTEAAVRVGRIVAARLMVMGSLNRKGTKTYLTLRVVDTETTIIQAAMPSELLQPLLEREGVADQFVATLLQKLRAAYPLQGRIVEASGDEVVLNIGSEHGVTPGLTLQVLREEVTPDAEGKTPSTRPQQVGMLEVTSVEEARFSRAKALQQKVAFAPGWKVREK